MRGWGWRKAVAVSKEMEGFRKGRQPKNAAPN